MKTSISRSWRSLSSKIHPPLPMTPRESERLTSLLKASFKQRFDREHRDVSLTNEHSADVHVRSILTNPLFKYQSQRDDVPLGQLQNRMRRPTHLFKERVSQGRADLKTAIAYLRVQDKICFAHSLVKRKEAMRASDTTSTVLQWLWSSGAEETGHFLRDMSFIRLFVPFLIVEGHQSLILVWLQRCYCPGETPFTGIRESDAERISYLFLKLIAGENTYGSGLEAATKLFVRSTDNLKNSDWDPNKIKHHIRQAAWLLTRIILQRPKGFEVEPHVLQAILKTMKDNSADHLTTAHLYLLIPKQPDPQPALAYLKRLSPDTPEMVESRIRPYVLLLGLKAAQLFSQDCQKEALWIMDFVQANFAQEIGLPPPQAPEPGFSNAPDVITEDEERSLNLLDQLAIQ